MDNLGNTRNMRRSIAEHPSKIVPNFLRSAAGSWSGCGYAPYQANGITVNFPGLAVPHAQLVYDSGGSIESRIEIYRWQRASGADAAR